MASLSKHSDLMLNMYSTIAIEASTFQLPSTKLCLRDKCKAMFGNFRQDFMVHYVQSHHERLIQTGGIKTVFTEDDLFVAMHER